MERLSKMEAANASEHALLSASSSHRWLECPPSARAEERYPDEGSEFAREGSLAHAIAAKKLKERLGLPTFEEEAEIRELKIYSDGEMQECTSDYADFVMGRYMEAARNTPEGRLRPEISIEKRLDYSKWVRDGFGTGDAVIASHDAIEVIDFKYGRGVKVQAEGNSQMKLYALGALEWWDYLYGMERVRMTVYQPRIGNVSSWECGVSELLEWADNVLKPTAMLAWQGLGARKSGEWCKFCKARGDCPRLADDATSYWKGNPFPSAISPERLSFILRDLPKIKDWVKAVEERSLAMALEGEEIPGFKVVEGRSVRKIKEPIGVISALTLHGFDGEELMKPRELKTLTELEKMVGKKLFGELCGGFLEKPPGKPTLVPEGDRRGSLENNDFKDLEI